MSNDKIMVIGCPGAGKSYFARQLHEITAIPLYHLDMIWHKADKTNISEQEFDQKLTDIMAQKQWIIDGNYQRTLEKRLVACDTVYFLDYPVSLCLESALSRIGKKRDDMPWIEEEADEEFISFIKDFPNEQLGYIYQLLQRYPNKNIIIFKDREQSQTYLENLKELQLF